VAIIDDVARPEFRFTGNEAEILWSKLDFLRSTILKKCEGLGEQQLKLRSVMPSELSLLELLQHLTGAERHWFQECLAGMVLEPLYTTTPDGEIEPLDPTTTEETVAQYLTACDDSRRISAAHSLEEVVFSVVYDQAVSSRFIAVHMIEEYARHCGHADLLRETIDGAVGE
jgi:hypothetical protein